MIRNIRVGIDIGSSITRVVVGEYFKGEKNPKIIGVGESETMGMRHGYIISFSDTVASLKKAILIVEKSSGIKIKRAFVSICGISMKGEIAMGYAIISKADGEVTNLDINKAFEDCENNINLGNKKIINSFAISYKLDGKEVLGKPEGMKGNKLELKAIFITYSKQHCEDLLEVLAEAGVETIDFIPSAISASFIALSKKQKIVGSALVNIGAETTSVAVFENESLISLYVFSIGGADITNDIALCFKITLEEAENLKKDNTSPIYPKKKIEEIIEARLSDIFELIDNHLKKIKRSELLPAGIVFVGGGANILKIEELSKTFLKLPSKIGNTEIFGNAKTKLRNSSYFTVLGLLMNEENREENEKKGVLFNFLKDVKNTLKSNLKQLLP